MLSFASRRALQVVPLLLLVSLLVFALIHAAPGGPLSLYLDNPNVRPQDIERLRRQMGLDRPLAAQYLAWLRAFIVGDWGYSYADGRPVMDRLLERVPATLQLIGISSFVAVIVATIVALVSSVRRGFDRAATIGAVAGISLPVFWLGLVLQLVFANALGWLPSSGRSTFGGSGTLDRLAHLVLPAAVLAVAHAAAWSRYLRSSMRQALAEPFIMGARSRGVSEGRIVTRHALRNALLPFVTVVLLDASMMASGAVVTESVFAWPGVGGLFTEALAKRDYTVLMAFLMCGSVAVAVLNLVADVVVHTLDPRTRGET
ncbi:MAG: ABC transporter permease [Gemmatimonadaceae bacterium]|nr:ABC transporter permease [Gemmatimonadaceae bacterium]